MSLNTLLTTVSGIIQASHITDILTALRLQFVGRNSSGAPASGQDLGTETYPWGDIHGTELFVDDITIDGRPVVKEKVQRSRNGIISGRTRTTSGQPDFIRASGSALECTILATATPLKMVINDEIVTVTSDIVVTVPTASAVATKTIAAGGVPSLGQNTSKTAGEGSTAIIFSTGTTSLYNDVYAFKAVATGEVWIGFYEDYDGGVSYPSAASKCFRGWFFDSSGNPVERDVIAGSGTVKFLKIHWIFIQNNGTTVEATEYTPIYSDTAPTTDLKGNAVVDSQYWFDLVNQTWKRYNGATWEILNRLLIGHVVVDPDTGPYVEYSRSFDFDNDYEEINNITLEKLSATQLTVNKPIITTSVYGERIKIPFNKLTWTMPGDLDTGTEQSKFYYVYLTESGDKKLSLESPHNRGDLLGFYHPFNSWRCVGYVDNTTGDFEQSNNQLDKGIFQGNADGQVLTPGGSVTRLQMGTNIFIDNLQRWDTTQNMYHLYENEIYKVTLKIGYITVAGFSGAANDLVLNFWLNIDSYNTFIGSPSWGVDWEGTTLCNVYDNTTLDNNVFEISHIIQGERGRGIQPWARAYNCTSVTLGDNCTLSINQIN